MKLCPVCHMEVDEQEALRDRRSLYYAGRFYYLMCPRCKWAFLMDPARYAFGKGRLDKLPIAGPCGGERAGAI